MEGEQFLSYMAQTGVAVAGFTGLVSSFRKESDKWKPNELAGVILILTYSISLTLISLISFLLYYLTKEEVLTWKISSLIISVFLIVQFIDNLKKMKSFTKEGFKPRKKILFIWVVLITPLVGATINVLNFYFGEMIILFFGYFLMLFIILMQLSVFIISFATSTKS